MTTIEKKIDTKYFRLVKSGEKKFELRLADFRIKTGDVVLTNCKRDNDLIKKFPLINALAIEGGILSRILATVREFDVFLFDRAEDG